MPCAIITFKKFVTDHRDDLVNMIIAFSKASDQIKSYPGALKKSAEIAVTVYNNMDASYYRGMYIGETVTDATGEKVEVGGNKVMNLADNMEFFGLTEGGSDIYQTVYNTYAQISLLKTIQQICQAVQLLILKLLINHFFKKHMINQ